MGGRKNKLKLFLPIVHELKILVHKKNPYKCATVATYNKNILMNIISNYIKVHRKIISKRIILKK